LPEEVLLLRKSFGEGVSSDMTEGIVAASHLMHPTKPPDCIYVKKTLEQCCLGCRNSQGVWEGV